MSRSHERWYGVVAFRSIFGVLVGTVIIPTCLLTSVGILQLVLWRESFDLAFGVLVLSFSVASIAGGIVAAVLLRRSALRAGAQGHFISSVSHELKTPLTSIKLFADTLLLGRVTSEAEKRECLEHIAREAERLYGLVERLLDLRRMEEGVRVYDARPILVDELVEAAMRSQMALLEERGVAVRVATLHGIPRIVGDFEALVSALANLVQNAVLYGGEGGLVELRARRAQDEVRLEVEDHGPGIPRRAIRFIFDRFYRGKVTLSPRAGGLGLGLALVREIAQAHGGDVEVYSQEGKGSTFVLRLPMAPADTAADATEEEAHG